MGRLLPRFQPLGVRGGKPQNEHMFSGLPPKADNEQTWRHVRFVPLTSDLRLDAPQQSLLRYSMRPGGGVRDIVS